MIKICLVLVMVVAINAATMQDCERKVLQDRVIKNYIDQVSRSWTFCKELKFVRDGLLNSPSCLGEIITAQRLWLLQFIYLDNTLSPICGEPVATDALKKLVKHSPSFELLKEFPSLEHDHSHACAKEVHVECRTHYLADAKKENFCQALEAFDRCYEKGAKRCKAKIIQDYYVIVRDVSENLLSVYRKEILMCANN
ncbi:uncharacterized protein LOC110245506 [Exaiptasia diaphana]|uniref:Uncharacterized protein n=1 Tax=Exaiptasia diaphana TaxID=2652724 RepID=A0A913XP65_EXADI|nr:uncharacterized protein LOC110245506 [Exaiptasia diaphana]